MFRVRLFESNGNSPNTSVTTNISFSTEIPARFLGTHDNIKTYKESFKDWIESCEEKNISEVYLNDYYRILDAINFVDINFGKLFYIILQSHRTYQSFILSANLPKNYSPRPNWLKEVYRRFERELVAPSHFLFIFNFSFYNILIYSFFILSFIKKCFIKSICLIIVIFTCYFKWWMHW